MKRIVTILTATLIQSCAHHEKTFKESESFDSFYSQYNENIAPGFSLLMTKNNKVIKKSSYGYADISMRTKINSKTIFRLASNTKAFTAKAVRILEERKLISAENSVRAYLPELPAFMNEIKVKHLLDHRSGLPNYEFMCDPDRNKKITNDVVMKWLIQEKKLKFPAGSKYEYSNMGYLLLAELVARVSGVSWDKFITENILRPLNMKSSYVFTKENEEKKAKAISYGSWPWFNILDWNPCNYTFGDDGIYTNMDDYQKWIESVTRDVPWILQGKEYSYGWEIGSTPHGKIIHHRGSWNGFRTLAQYYVDKDVWIVILSNYSDIPMNDIVSYAEETFMKP